MAVVFLLCASCGDPQKQTGATEHAVPGSEVTYRTVSKKTAGIVGRLYLPEKQRHDRAVMVLGGSEGGTPRFVARSFAEEGYVALALAYFGEPGLPDTLERIPLEYFAKGLRYLRKQPPANDKAPMLWGMSRGGEAALQIATTYPDLLLAAAAAVPADVRVCAYPGPGPSWTLHGKPLPCVAVPSAMDSAAAEIEVARIEDPVLLVCGGYDLVWDSCSMSRAVVERMEADANAPRHELLAYEAGHAVGAPPDASGNSHARLDARRRTLEFLEEVQGRHP